MAKQSMIQREYKRDRLILKHRAKREVLKQELGDASSFQERLALYKKMEKFEKT